MSEVQTGAIAQHDADAQGDGHRRRTVINWVLAGLTVPGALAIILYQYAQVLATAGCSERTCAKLGPSPFVFGLIEYGAPVVAVLAVALWIGRAPAPHTPAPAALPDALEFVAQADDVDLLGDDVEFYDWAVASDGEIG